MTTLVKLYNKGKRTVQGTHANIIDDQTGLPKPYSFGPDSSMAFAPEEAEKLRRLFPKELIDLNHVTQEFEHKTRDSENARAMISSEAAEREKKAAIEEAVAQEVARALSENNAKHEAARIEADLKAKEELDAALALLDEGKEKPSTIANGEDDKFTTMNTVDKVLSGKKTK